MEFILEKARQETAVSGQISEIASTKGLPVIHPPNNARSAL